MPRALLRLLNCMVGPALCPAMRARGEFPSVEPLPSAGSARGSRTRVCSPASSVLRVRLTARRRACRPYRPRRSPTGPRPKTRTPLGSPGSRVWNFHACSGSSTPPQTPTPCLGGVGVVAFSLIEQDRPAKVNDFGAPWLACAFHPNGRFDESRYRPPPSVGGRSDWLSLLRRTLSFPIPNRFIPAHSSHNFWPPSVVKKFFRNWPRPVLGWLSEMSAR